MKKSVSDESSLDETALIGAFGVGGRSSLTLTSMFGFLDAYFFARMSFRFVGMFSLRSSGSGFFRSNGSLYSSLFAP